ncbi:MAG TPA: heavy metal-associated domain-containing protein [Kofleriaceae bacterium]|nr:heavy metal-associated domain-containing protein [Kofleriaceae bacterium]
MITTLRVSGMTCNGCVKHVDAALREVPGVSAVEVDLAAGHAKVVHEDIAPPAVLIAAVGEAGYQASE